MNPANSISFDDDFQDIKVAGERRPSYTFNKIDINKPLTNLVITIPCSANRIKEIPLHQPYNRLLKRTLDISVSLLVIIFFLSWMIPLVGLLIKLESKGGIFFKQLRSGLNNKAFLCYKFRSMYINQHSDSLQAQKEDSRITRIGTFLRKTSIDEFPQFINVLKGEMSLVGPRPHMLKHTEMYGNSVQNYMNRLIIKQGLTGWAQANGYRGETQELLLMEQRVRHDLWYLENWSLKLDIKIILLTVKQVFKGLS